MIKNFILLIISIFSANLFSQSGIVAPDAILEKVFEDGFFTEGPAEGPDRMIYFSDLTFTSESGMQPGYIWKYDPKTDSTVIFRSPSGMSNGIEFDSEGRIIVCQGADFGGRCLVRTDMLTGKSQIIAGLYNNKPFNSPNDLIIDKKGRIYFTDPRYAGHEPLEQPVMGVYRLDPDGKVSLIIDNIGMPNGIAISPDEKSLYIGCNDEGFGDDRSAPGYKPSLYAIFKYDLKDNGDVELNKTFIKYGNDEGPDGIDIDEKGNVYAAVRNESNPGIHVYNPEGKEISFISTPEVPSNLTFSKDNYIYITAGKSLYRIKINKKV